MPQPHKLLALIIILSIFLSILLTSVVAEPGPDWLGGWNKRVKITIDHSDIDSTLSNFPILIYLSTSSGRDNDDVSYIFDELQNNGNRKKIAVTTDDGTTQCNVEIEKWDTALEKAWLWVKIPSISDTIYTDLYLYYDRYHVDNLGYIGDIGDIPSQNVWVDWKTVCHMAQPSDSGEIDSVTGSLDYAKTGTVTSVDGKIDKARRSTNGDSNYLVKSAAGFPDFRPITVMAWLKFSSWLTGYARPFSREPSGSGGLDWECGPSCNYRLRWWVGSSFDSNTVLTLDTWYFVTTTYVDPTSPARIYINGVEDRTSTLNDKTCSNPLYLFRSGKGTNRGMDGYIDEFRMYNDELSAGWIKASFESERDHLLDFGIEERIYDFGDAPETGTSYPTTLAIGARHAIVPNFMLGTVIDSETDGQPTLGADGDDINGVTDDEDGVTLPSLLIPGTTQQITVDVTGSGLLDAWIDWDDNGVWDAGEHLWSGTSQPVSGVGNIFNINVPSSATGGDDGFTYARFRLSTAGSLSLTGLANDGEVEDYRVEVAELDFGDAPDSPLNTYPTLLASGARHVIVQGLYLGSSVDAEVDGQSDVNALGDDNNGIPDDEDGVTFTTLSRGQPYTITVTAVGSGLLNAWIDWDSSGTWDAGEQIFTNEPLNSETKSFTKTVPLTAVVGQTFARFRFDSQGDLSPTGLADDGEVEDYAIPLEEAYDFGDAPDDASHNYKTLLTDGARHRIGEIFMGATVDDETDGQPSIGAIGDDTDADGDDEDGVVFPSLPYIVGSTGNVKITVSERTSGFISDINPAYLHGWIDWNQDGDWDDYLENIFCGYEIYAAGAYTIFFHVPDNAVPGNTYARFRLDDENLNQVTGLAQNGEVEDYLVDPAVARFLPRHYPVGGFLIPDNKLTILAPYLALILLIGAISSILVKRKKL